MEILPFRIRILANSTMYKYNVPICHLLHPNVNVKHFIHFNKLYYQHPNASLTGQII
jgi:hypothetical protein